MIPVLDVILPQQLVRNALAALELTVSSKLSVTIDVLQKVPCTNAAGEQVHHSVSQMIQAL